MEWTKRIEPRFEMPPSINMLMDSKKKIKIWMIPMQCQDIPEMSNGALIALILESMLGK